MQREAIFESFAVCFSEVSSRYFSKAHARKFLREDLQRRAFKEAWFGGAEGNMLQFHWQGACLLPMCLVVGTCDFSLFKLVSCIGLVGR